MKTSIRRISLILAAAICGLASTPAHAQIIAYDGFSYTAGDPLFTASEGTSLNGGTGWNSTWFRTYSGGNKQYFAGNQATVVANQFSGQTASPFTPVGASAQGLANNDRGTREFAASNTANAFNVAATGPADAVYVSFLMDKGANISNALTLNFFSGNQDTGGALLSLAMGSSGSFRAQMDSIQQTQLSNAISANTDYFIVLKLSSGLDSRLVNLDAGIYTSAASVPLTEPGSWTYSVSQTYAADFSINALQLITSVISDKVVFDEVRLGGDYASVTAVPEPSSTALLIGAFGLLALWRRRSYLASK